MLASTWFYDIKKKYQTNFMHQPNNQYVVSLFSSLDTICSAPEIFHFRTFESLKKKKLKGNKFNEKNSQRVFLFSTRRKTSLIFISFSVRKYFRQNFIQNFCNTWDNMGSYCFFEGVIKLPFILELLIDHNSRWH